MLAALLLMAFVSGMLTGAVTDHTLPLYARVALAITLAVQVAAQVLLAVAIF